MASRAEIERVAALLRSAPGFRDYVKILEGRRDDIITTLLNAPGVTDEAMRGEARAYNTLLTQLLREST